MLPTSLSLIGLVGIIARLFGAGQAEVFDHTVKLAYKGMQKGITISL